MPNVPYPYILAIGHRKWLFNTNLFLIKQFLITNFDCSREVEMSEYKACSEQSKGLFNVYVNYHIHKKQQQSFLCFWHPPCQQFFTARGLSQITFAFFGIFDLIRTLICTFTVVNIAFFVICESYDLILCSKC